jgi:hypothetical protein
MPSQDAETSSALTALERVDTRSQGDVELVLDMLGEYTQKLRGTYKGFDEKQSSVAIRFVFGVTVISIGVSVGSGFVTFFAPELRDSKHLVIPIISVVVAVVVAVVVVGLSVVSRPETLFRVRQKLDREELIVCAASLARLIRTASQMHEHGAASSFAQKLALDLKLGEAEVVLQHSMRYINTDEIERVDLIASGAEPRVERTPRAPLARVREPLRTGRVV